MEVNYDQKISQYDHDQQKFVEKPMYKFRPGQRVYFATGVVQVKEVEIVHVSYPEGYEYSWVVKDVSGDNVYRAMDSDLFETRQEAIDHLRKVLDYHVRVAELQVIRAKGNLLRFEQELVNASSET